MIAVLRIGHRIGRDDRITTHVALVARAFGADKIFITVNDKKIKEVVASVCKRFGGTFDVEVGVNQKDIINRWKGTIVHLTMYGEKLNIVLKKMDKNNDLLIIVGAEKVPASIYQSADFNVSIGNQPHSEVAALAIFLDRYTKSKWQKKHFNGDIEIIPTNKGKRVISHKKNNME